MYWPSRDRSVFKRLRRILNLTQELTPKEGDMRLEQLQELKAETAAKYAVIKKEQEKWARAEAEYAGRLTQLSEMIAGATLAEQAANGDLEQGLGDGQGDTVPETNAPLPHEQ